MKLRTDARSIAILAIFAAMILALEILPIPLLTDIPLFGGFTLDPTGIPITIVFLAFGSVFSLILIPIMWIAIAYRNPIGSVFKGFAEFYTLFGLIIAKLFLRNRQYDWKIAAPIYLTFGVAFRAIGMYITNIFLIQWLYGSPLEGAILYSATFVIPNIIQAIINILVGILIFIVIPENLAIQARFGKYGADEYDKYEEISAEELESAGNE
ncbi:MAG: hypothetical protein KGD60_07550 [Candidatus Thorarchaeota archaeon]|nr:hypothetical protein [Candidatus Thorarchaeota archaeon]